MNSKQSLRQLLSGLGFSEADAATYESLLGLETVSIRKVAAASGINRGTTYEAIKRLQAAGLVTARRSGQREYFAAESPEKIYELIRDKRKDLLAAQQQAQVLVPELLARQARPAGQPLVRYYQDDEGIVAILHDVLQTCRQLDAPEYYVYSSQPLRRYLYRKFPKFTDQRVAEGIGVKVIAIGEGGDPADLSERRWLPAPQDGSISSYMILYANKLALISISSDFTPYGVVIEDAGAVSMQRLLFERLWSGLDS